MVDMVEKSLAAVLEGHRNIKLREFPLPEIGSEEMIVKMEALSLCGSDPKFYRGELDWYIGDRYPVIMGDEILGRIYKVGEKTAKYWNVKEGDRVIVDAKIPCGKCNMCLSGMNWFLCKEGMTYGVMSCKDPPHLLGGMSEYLYVPPKGLVYKVPEEIPTEAAVICAVILGDALHWIETLGKTKLGDTVAILGPGPQGLASTLIAREAAGVSGTIIVAGYGPRDSKRLELAKKFGADYTIDTQKETLLSRVEELTGGEGAEVVLETAGAVQTITSMLDLVKPLGTAIHIAATGGREYPFVPEKIWTKEMTLTGGLGHLPGSVERCLKYVQAVLKTGKTPIKEFISHKFPLEKAEEALRTMGMEIEGQYPVKVMIDFRGR